MWLDLAGRVRWGNVALALAVSVVLAGAVVGPLTTAPPVLPPDRTVPLLPAIEGPAIAQVPAEARRTGRKAGGEKRAGRVTKRGTETKRGTKSARRAGDKPQTARRPEPAGTSTERLDPPVQPREGTAPLIARGPVRTTQPRPPTTGEFNFEGG